jgi:hypothetical protein
VLPPSIPIPLEIWTGIFQPVEASADEEANRGDHRPEANGEIVICTRAFDGRCALRRRTVYHTKRLD